MNKKKKQTTTLERYSEMYRPVYLQYIFNSFGILFEENHHMNTEQFNI